MANENKLNAKEITRTLEVISDYFDRASDHSREVAIMTGSWGRGNEEMNEITSGLIEIMNKLRSQLKEIND